MDAPSPLAAGLIRGLAFAAGLAFALARLGTPLAISAARRTGFVDRPGGSLKTHADATPYLGGMAVFVPFLATAALVFDLDQAFLGILLAATLAALLGLMDDFGAMRPGVKLVGQGVVVLVLLRADVRVGIEALPVGLNMALTALWMLAVMNAVNFLDVMDGVAATTCLVASAFFLGIALLSGEPAMASLSAALLGALAGYLKFSLPRARIFLGDCGSLFLGTTLGALALALDYSAESPWGLLAPVLILGIPCFEIAFTVMVRIARGRPPWKGSPDHVVLRLRRFGLAVPRILAVLVMVGATVGALGASLMVADIRTGAIGAGIALLIALVAAGLLWRAPDPT